MKRGSKVWVCHDGKWTRKVPGHIVATRQGHHVLVEFQHADEVVQFWARKVAAVRYLRSHRSNCFAAMKHYSYFRGWANIDLFRPRFAVYKRRDNRVST